MTESNVCNDGLEYQTWSIPSACSIMAPKQSPSLRLAELNQRSAPRASFDVAIFHPRIEDYEYVDKKTNGMKKGSTFRCIIVSEGNPEDYMTAELTMRGSARAPIEQCAGRCKAGLRFRMSNARLKTGLKQEYLHTPLKLVVDLNQTKLDGKLQSDSSDGKHLAPEPVMSVAQCKALRTAQRFDVTALVAEISDPRAGGAGREVRDVILVDGSKASEDGKLMQIKVAFFTSSIPSARQTEYLKLVEDLNGTNRAGTFFAIQGRQKEDGYQFEFPKTSSPSSRLVPKRRALHQSMKF